MGIAASMASGIIEANRTGGTVKRIHCGWAAHAAICAARMAEFGITGPPTALEGRFGFFRAFLGDRYHAAAITDGLGEEWCVPGINFKPYPANHFTHAGIDAAIALRQRGVRPAEVVSLTLGVSGPDAAHGRRADRGQAHPGDRLPGPVQRAVHGRRRAVRRPRPRRRAG